MRAITLISKSNPAICGKHSIAAGHEFILRILAKFGLDERMLARSLGPCGAEAAELVPILLPS
jgi:hypothetical protein